MFVVPLAILYLGSCARWLKNIFNDDVLLKSGMGPRVHRRVDREFLVVPVFIESLV